LVSKPTLVGGHLPLKFSTTNSHQTFNTALRDLGIDCFAICGIATEIGIEPTVRHGADLGYVPVVIADACGAGNEEEAARSLDLLRFAGDAILTDTATITPLLRRASSGSVSG
jgi:biuret amidohydrolase